MKIRTQEKSPLWHSAGGLRIWRSPDSHFSADEPRDASKVYTDEVIAGIAGAGFNALWLRGRLRELMQSTVFPSLNDSGAEQRRQSLRELIERARRHGVGVYLFFNEPLALSEHDLFWESHAELAGHRHRDYGFDHDSVALCTSTPLVQKFLREAVDGVFEALSGLDGVILITASEYFTHCWSHHWRYSNGELNPERVQVTCPRCQHREPSDIVAELVNIWHDAAQRCVRPPRILCWNWSWSIWYPDPQSQVINKLPDGVRVMLDFERGMRLERRQQKLFIDEYSLSIPGPGERFKSAAKIVQSRGLDLDAKVQIGTTHEVATVPNLPLVKQLHAKLVQLSRAGVSGIMATWNFGCSLTLNTAAMGLYIEDADRYADSAVFMKTLAKRYFGVRSIKGVQGVCRAWRAFGLAFEHYPFGTRFLYSSPVNAAPAYPLSLDFHDRPMGGSWLVEAWGDRLEESLPVQMTITDVAESLASLASLWSEGVTAYSAALAIDSDVSSDHAVHRAKELSCARMIGVQFQMAANIYRFHAWRKKRMGLLGIQAPCTVTLDYIGEQLLRDHCRHAQEALALCQKDRRLGWHQECHAYLYSEDTIRENLTQMEAVIQSAEVMSK